MLRVPGLQQPVAINAHQETLTLGVGSTLPAVANFPTLVLEAYSRKSRKRDFLLLLPLLLPFSFKETLLNSQGRSSNKEKSHSASGGLSVD